MGYIVGDFLINKSGHPAHNIPTSSFARPSKIYSNWDIRFENMPSGNPEARRELAPM
jgi:hypothetical protein